MTYEETPINLKPSKVAVKKTRKQDLSQFGTGYILWQLVIRHKFAIMATGNVVLVLNWALPEWPQMLLGLAGK